jgi:hypothetical protein
MEELVQWLSPDVTERRMKEAGTYGAIRLDHRGNPGCVAENARKRPHAAERRIIRR